MPWLITNQNYESVVRSHLSPNEQLVRWEPAMRGVVALTNQRLIVSDFPWFGSANLLFEAPLAGLSQVSVSGASDACQINTEGGGFTRRALLPNPYFKALGEIVQLINDQIKKSGGRIAVTKEQSPSVLQTVECERCGASLMCEGVKQDTVKCIYCGNDQKISTRARAAIELDSQLSALLLQARAEIATTLYLRSGAVAVYELTGAFLGMALASSVATALGRLTRLPSGVAVFVGVFLAIVFGVLFVPPFHMVAEQLARANAKQMARKVELQRMECKCLNCGAPLQIPGGTALLECAHCNAALLVAEGLVTLWKGDSTKAIEEWRTQANTLVNEKTGLNLGVLLMMIVGVTVLLLPTVGLYYLAFSKKH